MSGRLNIFEAENVSKIYSVSRPFLQRFSTTHGVVRAVDSVSLNVREGEVLGIIGESGSGKTTFGFLLANLESISDGVIRYRLKPLTLMNRQERANFRRKVQVVFQDSGSALNPRRSINNALKDSLRLGGTPANKRDAAVEELLVSVGLSREHGRRYPHQLSGGQRQRVGIARALAMKPEVIVADEPVSALDVSLQGQIINLLMRLQTELNLTVILISHDIAVVRHVCHRVGVMYGGKLVELGETSQVVDNPQHDYTKRLIAAVPKGLTGRLQQARVLSREAADSGATSRLHAVPSSGLKDWGAR